MKKIKLHGLHYNNLYFGPKGEEHLHVPRVHIQATPEAMDDPALDVDFYIAQGNLVDSEPTPQSIAGLPIGPVILPGWPEDRVPAGTSVPATFVKLTGVTSGTFIAACLGGLVDSSPISRKLWSGNTYTSGFLSSFTRGGALFNSIGSYTPPMPEPPIPPGVYIWAGWGVMYYPGLFRPSRFEQYPQLSLAQMPIVYGNQIFTLDYCKTEIVFEITSSGEYYLLSGKVL